MPAMLGDRGSEVQFFTAIDNGSFGIAITKGLCDYVLNRKSITMRCCPGS